jgi:hypothetical protein
MKEACIFVVALTRATGQDIKLLVVSAHREKNVSYSQIYFLINLQYERKLIKMTNRTVDIVVADLLSPLPSGKSGGKTPCAAYIKKALARS